MRRDTSSPFYRLCHKALIFGAQEAGVEQADWVRLDTDEIARFTARGLVSGTMHRAFWPPGSAVVDRKSSMYLEPIISLCFRSAFSESSSSAKRTNASPVALPSGLRTKRTPSESSLTLHAESPLSKNSIYSQKKIKYLDE